MRAAILAALGLFLVSPVRAEDSFSQKLNSTVSALSRDPNELIQKFEGKRRTDFLCLALSMYHEGRQFDQNDLTRVGWVMRNRLDDSKKYSGYCAVVLDPGQFKWLSKDNYIPKKKSDWNLTLKLANLVFVDEDYNLSDDATYFLQPKLATRDNIDGWASKLQECGFFGVHKFYRIPQPAQSINYQP